ncbi:hypothetical protein A3F34_01575 [Candidatus Roizmanbacteria bacterium RIFCSPHIGHO2_12_FULL_44_10]|uniref:Uncharacterized protein n=1 Tax=Candidatus Roizmanbacteria bacterium RIFCSPHIGHO2_12_FULL_44_10 TaxID=1802054 RepID=A0A1F7I5J4_9BACT|nr:MAG: hypothetical protein A3F34_01575 [Candidatus Roizmanbacteria bacterium RIFCSPHIGHO2_12_FULL_44_10]
MKKVISSTNNQTCPECGSPLGEPEITPNGKQVRRCSNGSWDSKARKVTGCAYAQWSYPEPEKLDEDCPKCGEHLVLITTRKGRRLKRCSTAGWDKETKTATGCDHVQWL